MEGTPQNIEVRSTYIQAPIMTQAEKNGEGLLVCTFIVNEGMEPIARVFHIGEAGQSAISTALTGLTLARPGDIPNAERR